MDTNNSAEFSIGLDYALQPSSRASWSHSRVSVTIVLSRTAVDVTVKQIYCMKKIVHECIYHAVFQGPMQQLTHGANS